MEDRIACSTYGYRFLSLEAAIQRIADNEFTAVDIVGTRPHLLPEDYPERELEEIAARIRDAGLRVSAITPFDGHPFWQLTAANRRHRLATIDHVKRCIDVAAVLGAGVVQAITGMPIAQDVPFDTAWGYASEGLRECAEYGAGSGIRIGLEGEENNVVRTSADVARMISDVDHPNLGALLEIGHANVMATDDPVFAIHLLGDKIVYCHAHDNYGTADDHSPPGDGNVDWPQVMRALARAGYEGDFALELLVHNPDGAATRSRDLLAQYLRESAETGSPVV